MFELINFKVLLVTALIFVPLERLIPLRPQQKLFRKHWLNDLTYLFFNGIFVKVGLLLVVGSAIFFIELSVPHSIGENVRLQPIWLQLLEAIFLSDLGFYFAHRTFHSVPFLWKFHAIHHSIEELDWLAAHRVHPIDQIATKAASYLPLFLLGFSSAAIAIAAILYHVQSILIHANIKLDFGPLKWVLASPQFHHWHHAKDEAAIDKNFSGQLSLVDVFFGTLFLPPRFPEVYGTEEPVPDFIVEQIAYPFRRPKNSHLQWDPKRGSGEIQS